MKKRQHGKDNRTELSNRADNSVGEYIDNGCTDRSHDHGTAAGDDETGSTTAHKDQKTTEKKDQTSKASKKKAKKIKQKNKVKKLKKNKNLKEEKVVSNIIPKIYNDTRLA